MPVDIHLLGPFRVQVDGHEIPEEAWARRDASALVKVLALARDRQLHREQLIDRLWPELTVEEAAPRLHKATHFARRALGRPDAVVLRREMVALLPGTAVSVDVPAFEEAARAALADRTVAAADAVLERYPAEPLPADAYAEWAQETRQRVEAVREQLLRQARRWQELVELDPTDERARLALMRTVRTSRPPGPAEQGRLEQQIRFCRTQDGVTLAYATSGGGPPLVKAANWLTHADHDWHSPVWRHWLVELSRRHRLVRYDERGCGLSDRDVGRPSLDAWVHDLETVVDEVGLRTFPLLGISQGAAVAVAYAAQHPERVTRLVLYGSYPQGRLVRAAHDDEARRRHEVMVELARLGWGQDDPAFRQVFTAQFMPGATRELWDAFNELQRTTANSEYAAEVLDLNGRIDVVEQARRVRVPTLVLHARQDQRPPFEQGRLMASLIPGSRFVALESTNHILLADEPAWPVFLAEVERFLAERQHTGTAVRPAVTRRAGD